jgi:hypothetical protein
MQTRSKFPLRITILLWLVLIITAWNFVRVVTSIAWHNTLETYAAKPGPFYIGLTGTIWTLIGLFLLWSFIRGARWTRLIFLITGSGYSIWIWVDKLFIQASLRANWPFDLLTTILLLSYTVVIVLDPHNQIYFMKRDL